MDVPTRPNVCEWIAPNEQQVCLEPDRHAANVRDPRSSAAPAVAAWTTSTGGEPGRGEQFEFRS